MRLLQNLLDAGVLCIEEYPDWIAGRVQLKQNPVHSVSRCSFCPIYGKGMQLTRRSVPRLRYLAEDL